MEEQEKIVREMLDSMEAMGNKRPTEITPKANHNYHFTWNAGSTTETGCHFHLFDDNSKWLKIAAQIEQYKTEEENKKLELVNFFNMGQEAGTWVNLLNNQGFALQLHVTKGHIYTQEQLALFISIMADSVTLFIVTAQMFFNDRIDLFQAIQEAEIQLKNKS